jgi:predicted CXXCH cytochrome family protein
MMRCALLRPIAVAVLLIPVAVAAQVRVGSPLNKHNLSVTGPGPMKSTTVTEICVFCHTPHNANPAIPLWNQTMSTATYQPYTSTTLAATVGQPTGASKLCLSCHDGTIALGNTINNGAFAMQGVNAQGQMQGASVLGLDLRDDHPTSFAPVTGSRIVNPPPTSAVKLDGAGQVQCTSCHDPHRMDIDTVTQKFLVGNNSSSALCVVCHNQTYWSTNPSTHSTSTKAYTSVQGAHTGYTTVATNGCESCHKPHTAGAAQRGLKAQEELSCGSGATQCHASSGIGRNIAAEFAKTYRHPSYDVTPSVHDASEGPSSATFTLPEVSAAASRHAECPDCHNAHASYPGIASAPKGSGKIGGVWGIDGNGLLKAPSGTPASVNEYEICYKCHADSANKPQPNAMPAGPYPIRALPQFNMRLMFDPANPSYHPIEAPGRNTRVPSLIAPWTTTSIMYCTDCHDNDTGPKAPAPGTGPAGPHGSNIKHLLVARYDADASTTTESAAAYALCYKCHNRTTVLSSTSFSGHTHAVGRGASCDFCHDPHGISSTQGNSTSNKFLINLDTRFLTPSGGILRIDDLGGGSVRCYMVCHGENHGGRTCSASSCG